MSSSEKELVEGILKDSSQLIINYEGLMRNVLEDARQFAEAASKVAFEIRRDIQDSEESEKKEEVFAEVFYRSTMTSLISLRVVSHAIDVLGLGAYKERIMELCAEKLLGPKKID